MAISDQFRPLTRPPQAITLTVRELLQKVGDGQVRVPVFQRPLRWQSQDVLDLFDSIWRGYPIGWLLFWKRPAAAGIVRVGSAELDAGETAEAWWVVDGQQRITALAAALLDLPQSDARWHVRFDPEQQQFLSDEVPPHRKGIDVPLHLLGDLRRLGRWIRDEAALDEALVDRIESAQQRLLDYSIPAYLVEADEEHALRAVFARVNSTRTRMRADEVFQALLGTPSSDEESLDLNILQRACDVDGFGVPSRGDVLKAVLAMSGIDPTRRLEDLSSDRLNELVTRSQAEDALRRTVSFFLKDCGVPHVSLIPYPVVFIILTRWFHLFPKTDKLTRNLLARWVWRGVASGAHQRAEVSRMREQVQAVRPDDPWESLARLEAAVNQRPTTTWTLEKFNLRSARSRVETLALFQFQPRDLYGEVSLAGLMSDAGRIAREVFAARDYRDLGAQERALARTAANRVLLDTLHTGLSTELKQWDWDRDHEALATHLIDKEAFELLRTRNIDEFLRRRAAAIATAVEQFTIERAAWDAMTLKPIEAYVNWDDDE